MRMKYVLLICCLLLFTSNVYAVSIRKLEERIERANNYLEEVMETVDTAIPSFLLKKCSGVVIIRQYNAGFIFGAKVGYGVALKKNKKTGEWSAPSFVSSADANFGLQVGGQAVDAIFLIMNKSGVESLLKVKCKLGANASVAAGPYGRDAGFKMGPDTAFLVYARARGFYGGLTLEGGVITQDNRANRKFYGKKVTVKEIFNNKVKIPDKAKELIRTLEKYCN